MYTLTSVGALPSVLLMDAKSSSCGTPSDVTMYSSAVRSGIPPSLAMAAMVGCLSLSLPLLKRPCSSCARFMVPHLQTLGFGAIESLSPQKACVGSMCGAGAHPWAARVSGNTSVPGTMSLSLLSRFLASAKLRQFHMMCLVVPLAFSQNGQASVSCCPALKALAGLQRLSERQFLISCALGVVCGCCCRVGNQLVVRLPQR